MLFFEILKFNSLNLYIIYVLAGFGRYLVTATVALRWTRAEPLLRLMKDVVVLFPAKPCLAMPGPGGEGNFLQVSRRHVADLGSILPTVNCGPQNWSILTFQKYF